MSKIRIIRIVKVSYALNNGPFILRKKKLENALRENSPVMKLIQNFPYVVCVLMALRILTFYKAF
jgi:hypothetical protein